MEERPLTVLGLHALEEETSSLSLPLFETVQAGFASPADDHAAERLDVSKLLIKHPAATFFVKVEGDSMKDAHIVSGDLLVVDRALPPSSGKIIVAVLNGEFTVKRLEIQGERIALLAANPNFPPLFISKESDFQVWGVVTYVIHKAL